MKIRLRFEKTGAMKYIGHLDMMRYFQKVIRRAGIDIRFSEGFSPHMIMSFAAPLGVGLESLGEYLDIEVLSTKSSAEAVRELNLVQVPGVCITDYVLLPEDAKPAMSLVSAADYEVIANVGPTPDYAPLIRELFLEKDSFPVTKKTKKKETVIDLKQSVYAFSWDKDRFFLRLSTGSETNIKPELLLQGFFEKLGTPYQERDWQIRRLEVYLGAPDQLKPLLSQGETIA